MGLLLFLGRLLLLSVLYGLVFAVAKIVWEGMPAVGNAAGQRSIVLRLRRGVGPITVHNEVWAEGSRANLQLPVTFGRQCGNGVQIEDPFVSACHAELMTDGTAIWLVDRGSKNGTWLGEKRLDRPVRIGAGQEFKLGGTLIRVEE